MIQLDLTLRTEYTARHNLCSEAGTSLTSKVSPRCWLRRMGIMYVPWRVWFSIILTTGTNWHGEGSLGTSGNIFFFTMRVTKLQQRLPMQVVESSEIFRSQLDTTWGKQLFMQPCLGSGVEGAFQPQSFCDSKMFFVCSRNYSVFGFCCLCCKLYSYSVYQLFHIQEKQVQHPSFKSQKLLFHFYVQSGY